MLHYIIDGNNLIGKVRKLRKLEGQTARESLSMELDTFFIKTRNSVSLHFDGFAKDSIRTEKIKIFYSDKKKADDWIRFEIEAAMNKRRIVVVSSDSALADFARKCGCRAVSSEDFAAEVFRNDKDEEEERIKGLKGSIEEFKRLFGDS